MKHLFSQAEENVGLAMVFTIVSAVQERLSQLVEEAEEARVREEERKRHEEEEAERQRFEGTRVQVETFLAWKAAFDAEMAELKLQKGLKSKEGPRKLTGEWLLPPSSILLHSCDI